ncbi:MAG TPA: DNA-formamidopyrimidine glycosylase family protein, partial [Rhizomicrobium sp.]
MPELPEVETVRMGLEPVFDGHTFTKVVTRRGDLRRPFPPDFAKRLTGRKVKRLWRRAKYLLADLDGDETLVVHLGMSGRMAVYAEGKSSELGIYMHEASHPEAGHGKHDHVVFETDAPALVVFSDHRRFGLMTLIESSKLNEDPLFKGLGPEPLLKDFSVAYLKEALKGKRTPIKSALL